MCVPFSYCIGIFRLYHTMQRLQLDTSHTHFRGRMCRPLRTAAIITSTNCHSCPKTQIWGNTVLTNPTTARPRTPIEGKIPVTKKKLAPCGTHWLRLERTPQDRLKRSSRRTRSSCTVGPVLCASTPDHDDWLDVLKSDCVVTCLED
jgi:hypothetical protein